MQRRSFLALATKTGGAVAAAVVGGPALLTTLSPAFIRRPPVWVRVGVLDDFEPGTVRKAVVELPREDRAKSLRHQGVFVLRTATDGVTVFSRTCTDLGCPVTWDPGSGWFFCPCHGGIFAQDGTPRAGPPKRPLYRYATRIDAGVLLIDINSVPPMA
jgi:menaquinol-cytochrome c reductase iron-sulfur subunit